MELTGTQDIRRDRAGVWAALNDPAVLKQCIPGCESLEQVDDHTFGVAVMAAVGPVKARFSGKLVLSDIRPDEGYSLLFEGTGGAAGFAKGGAVVSLARTESGTLLTYQAHAKVGGKMAQVGSRLIDGVAAKMSAEFFSRFNKLVEQPESPPVGAVLEPGATAVPTAGVGQQLPGGRSRTWAPIAAVALAALVIAVAWYLYAR